MNEDSEMSNGCMQFQYICEIDALQILCSSTSIWTQSRRLLMSMYLKDSSDCWATLESVIGDAKS